jgi:hypothetical protein
MNVIMLYINLRQDKQLRKYLNRFSKVFFNNPKIKYLQCLSIFHCPDVASG